MTRRLIAAIALVSAVFLPACERSPTDAAATGMVSGTLYLPAGAAGAVLHFSSSVQLDSVQIGPRADQPDALFTAMSDDGRVLVYGPDGLPRTIRLNLYFPPTSGATLRGEVLSVGLADGSLHEGDNGRVVLRSVADQ
jgi:hypothetical protein